jgi:hypothetical protein
MDSTEDREDYDADRLREKDYFKVIDQIVEKKFLTLEVFSLRKPRRRQTVIATLSVHLTKLLISGVIPRLKIKRNDRYG